MISVEYLISISKEEFPEVSKSIEKDDLLQLIELLNEKDDKIRYQSLQLLQCRSKYSDDIYPFWDVFKEKLKSSNSYQRSIGMMLIAENAKWDRESRLDDTIDDYLLLLQDEKPITIRQSIQALPSIVNSKPKLNSKIAHKLMSVNLPEIKETMRKLIYMDILNVLISLKKINSSDEIEKYIHDALTGGILDKKLKKQLEALL